jgi:two-component system invasion response regulator UvrY
MKKILIADDHHILRKGLKQILVDEYGEIEFGEAYDGREALTKLKESAWDILILDINMPGINGLDVLRYMKELALNTPVLVLSMHPEEQVAIQVIKSGAYGYLTKDAADTKLINAVNKVMARKRYTSLPIAVQLLEKLASENPPAKKP